MVAAAGHLRRSMQGAVEVAVGCTVVDEVGRTVGQVLGAAVRTP